MAKGWKVTPSCHYRFIRMALCWWSIFCTCYHFSHLEKKNRKRNEFPVGIPWNTWWLLWLQILAAKFAKRDAFPPSTSSSVVKQKVLLAEALGKLRTANILTMSQTTCMFPVCCSCCWFKKEEHPVTMTTDVYCNSIWQRYIPVCHHPHYLIGPHRYKKGNPQQAIIRSKYAILIIAGHEELPCCYGYRRWEMGL